MAKSNISLALDLSGVIVPLLTPFSPSGTVDTASLRHLVRYQVDAGVDGLFVFGSTGEFPALTAGQRAEVLETVVDEVGRRVPVIAGVADTSTQRSLDLARQAVATGADALVLTAPYYHVNSQAEIQAHFRAVREQSSVPLVAYNIPSLVKVPLSLDTLVSLAEDDVIVGLKDSGSDLQFTRKVVLATRHLSNFRVLTGLELMVDTAMAFGVHGSVPGLGNVAPHEYVALHRACSEGRWNEARSIQERLIRLFDICYTGDETMSQSASALSAFKSALRWRGVISTCEMASPMHGLSDASEGRVRTILEELALLSGRNLSRGMLT